MLLNRRQSINGSNKQTILRGGIVEFRRSRLCPLSAVFLTPNVTSQTGFDVNASKSVPNKRETVRPVGGQPVTRPPPPRYDLCLADTSACHHPPMYINSDVSQVTAAAAAVRPRSRDASDKIFISAAPPHMYFGRLSLRARTAEGCCGFQLRTTGYDMPSH